MRQMCMAEADREGEKESSLPQMFQPYLFPLIGVIRQGGRADFPPTFLCTMCRAGHFRYF